MKAPVGKSKIILKQGDLTKEACDAIVNAANSSLLGGGGVDGAIHRAGGPAILEACKKLNGCATGDAKITVGGNLPAKYVIHTVGPIWRGGGSKERELLASAYRRSLETAVENKLRSVAFPSISTGAYRFPIDEASRIAIKTVIDFLKKNDSLKSVAFVLFSSRDFEIYKKALEETI